MEMHSSGRPKGAYAFGERVWLRLPTEADAEGDWYDWNNDEATTRFTGRWRPNSPEDQKAFVRSRLADGSDVTLAVIETETGRHIGMASLSGIDWIHRFSDISIFIGDPEAHNKAVLGLEAFSLMLRIAFVRLNLDHVKGGYIDGQEQSGLMLKALRFTESGRIPDLYTVDGVKRDHVHVHLSREEWLKRNPLGEG